MVPLVPGYLSYLAAVVGVDDEAVVDGLAVGGLEAEAFYSG